MRSNNPVPNGLAVISELYRDHLIFPAMIAIALFAGSYLLTFV